MATLAVNKLSLAPLGAGDLIDRAVRLYRRHFLTLIRISTPPVVVSVIGTVMMTIGMRGMSQTPDEMQLALYGALVFVGVLLRAGGTLLTLIVMGGATRNLVTHLLWNEPVTARATYRNVRSRFWGLLGASILVGVWITFTAFISIIAWYFATIILVLAAVAFAQVAPAWLSAVIGVIGTVIGICAAMFLFFFLAGRVAYVPQVMLVEGKGVFDALGRSFSLARGNVRRLMAMTVFTTFAAYSALMILIIPLGWYGYLHGIDPSPWSMEHAPAWFAVGYQVLGEASSILLLPVWMLGLSLLYVDERVRHEGYDIELMAARQLGPMPQPTRPRAGGQHTGPYTPAIVSSASQPPPQRHPPGSNWSPGSTLGLR
ncbi:MAG TPA: hypothetical protein VK619_04710 [Pyrinomonadaceae bacterium]|nr:hypothetical protein [Pyrinomonadaceae bacterium]